ncbi:DUF7675 family protein [Lactobacillus delbrueckii]|uniref:DUF7675 family protein n=2 Tax=Lactobacillus delbrueckii TaxID=1584 RepID=UPI001E5D6763|nr:hypothetical protein [Lactobacillus delbrueckii]MCD5440287.1 hypothetical protein [Lactobacillus delbrueckii subsp. lactis]
MSKMKKMEEITFYRNKRGDKVWRVDRVDEIGGIEVSFDKKKIYNLWTDYPSKFSAEEIEIIKKEMPYWVDFFKSREEE